MSLQNSATTPPNSPPTKSMVRVSLVYSSRVQLSWVQFGLAKFSSHQVTEIKESNWTWQVWQLICHWGTWGLGHWQANLRDKDWLMRCFTSSVFWLSLSPINTNSHWLADSLHACMFCDCGNNRVVKTTNHHRRTIDGRKSVTYTLEIKYSTGICYFKL